MPCDCLTVIPPNAQGGWMGNVPPTRRHCKVTTNGGLCYYHRKMAAGLIAPEDPRSTVTAPDGRTVYKAVNPDGKHRRK